MPAPNPPWSADLAQLEPDVVAPSSQSSYFVQRVDFLPLRRLFGWSSLRPSKVPLERVPDLANFLVDRAHTS